MSDTTTSADVRSMACAVTQEVLETMFFSTAEPVECLPGPQQDDWITATVGFRGEHSGKFWVTLSPELARSMAAGFLGEEADELTVDVETQVGCELANMICGGVLSRLYPDTRPRIGPPERSTADTGPDGTHQCFETPEGRLSITLCMT